jgi:rare lipoprotein A
MKVVLSCTLALASALAIVVAPAAQLSDQQRPVKAPGATGEVHEGIASYYGESFRGKKTHTDEVFNPDKLTAACNILPLRIWVKVTNLRNKRSVNLWINDRMHPKNKRLIDVSARAAKELGFYARGLTRVRVEVIKKPR